MPQTESDDVINDYDQTVLHKMYFYILYKQLFNA